MRPAHPTVLLALCSCFGAPPQLAIVATQDGTEGSGGSSSTEVQESSSGSTSSAASSEAGSQTSSGSESTDGTEDSSSSSDASSSSSDGGSSSSGEAPFDPYGPCWPGEPAGGPQCEAGPHGALCVNDDAPRMTGYACTAECQSAAECPLPLSGTASPACADVGDFGVCILDCDVDDDCPVGMVCHVYASGALDPWPPACVWPWGWWT